MTPSARTISGLVRQLRGVANEFEMQCLVHAFVRRVQDHSLALGFLAGMAVTSVSVLFAFWLGRHG